MRNLALRFIATLAILTALCIAVGALCGTAQALDEPCAKWRWSDDPEYKITGVVAGTWETPETWEELPHTCAKIRQGTFTKTLCFIGHHADKFDEGATVTVRWYRHCSKSALTLIAAEPSK
jgi:hypothetical protein